MTYFPNVATRRIVIAEVTPTVVIVGGWTVHSGNTVWASFSRFFDAGSTIYRRVVGLRLDATDQTERTSVADVVANPGSWYWDEAASRLYVQVAVISDYTVMAFVTYYFSTEPATINRLASQPNTGIAYQPWIAGTPRLTRQVSDMLTGATIVESGDLDFTNGHGHWHDLIPGHDWRNKKVRILMAKYQDGTAYPERPDFDSIMTFLIGDIAADEQKATIKLIGPQKRLEKQIPTGRYLVADYPNLGQSVSGTLKWLGWGRARMKPDLTDTTSNGVYTIADAEFQTLFAVNDVVAILKADGTRTTLTVTTDYTVNLTTCVLTIVNATYIFADYDIEVDVTGKPDGSGSYLKTGSQIIKDILQTHLAIPTADIDVTSFTNADTSAPAEQALWIKAPRSIASLLLTPEGSPCLEKSILGALRQTVDGKWSIRTWNDAALLTGISLTKSDFVSFLPEPKIEKVAFKTNVHYGQDFATQAYPVTSFENLPVKYRFEVEDEINLYTYICSGVSGGSDAYDLASRVQEIAGAVSTEVEFELRGDALATVLAGDIVSVTYDPAPVSGGAFSSSYMQVLRLDIALFPVLKISGRLGTRELGASEGVRPNEFNFAALSPGFSRLLTATAAFFRRD